MLSTLFLILSKLTIGVSLSKIDESLSNQSSDKNAPLSSVFVAHLDDDLSIRFDSTDELKAIHLEIVATMKELLTTSYFYKEHFDQVRCTEKKAIKVSRFSICMSGG